MEAYLDIETTGLSSSFSYITVIGIYLVSEFETSLVQIIGDEITTDRLLAALEGVEVIYTYNGARFDLPFIKEYMGVDLERHFKHVDLMYDCWRCNLKGGFKAVEIQLGIERELHGVGGWEAVLLWQRHQNGDEAALPILLKYNQEDVTNLKVLKEKLKKHPLYHKKQ